MQLGKVRTGRASASLLENIKVEYYGEQTPIAQVGGISTPDARSIPDPTVGCYHVGSHREGDLGGEYRVDAAE